ncbi:Nnf1 [Penicillium capsulatum]|uniref:Nnf1 n=1 Tax=Penicillium capsulatum TaxID=69766 RepID=A0A9W9IRY6_9EURO|nr:Nnf1 [Penicillium capsulatum]
MAESNSHPPQQPPAAASPPPPASESQVPGPRASRLHQVFGQALARTLRANSYSNFASCFPTPARHVPASLESVWRQLNAKLEECANAEFEEIVAEREAVKHLNELDRLVNEARARKEGNEDKDGGREPGNAPHTLGAEELYQAHLTPYLQEAQSTLNNKLAATHAQNTELAQTVQAQRLEIEKLLAHVESVIADVEGAATAAAQFSKDNNIRQDAIQMDEEANSRQSV